MKPLVAGDPSVVGPYRLLGRLGEGAMGVVYLGRTAGGRTVAVKVIRPELARDAEFRARLRREVTAARRVEGSWAAPVLDADTESADPWVATRYVAGTALSEAVLEFGPLTEHGVRTLTAGLAEALAAIHGLGLTHRDVRPSNVMLSPGGPVLIDFGVARAMDSVATASLTHGAMVIGSPGSLSPEQVLGRPLDAASDVFQLGAVLAYAANGQGPFPADSAAALLYQVAHGEPDLGALQGELRALAAACLAKDPASRPTPQQIATTLAPEGAAGLITPDWLSAPVMSQLSRRTAELLDVETPPDPASTPSVPASEQASPAAPPAPPATPPAPVVGPPTPAGAVRAPDATLPLTPRASAPQPGRADNRRRTVVATIAVLLAAGLATTAALLTSSAISASTSNVAKRGPIDLAPVPAPASASSSPADAGGITGPYKTVVNLCDKVDTGSLQQLFGPLANTPTHQSLATDEEDGVTGTERGCTVNFGTSNVDMAARVYPTAGAARADYTNSTRFDSTYSVSPVALGEQAEQSKGVSSGGGITCWTYSLEVQDANMFIYMNVNSCPTSYNASMVAALTTVMKGTMAGLK
ncbi:serine/threonine-protein kinase [Streptacidiphilus sp. EB129]|uniref:serine/threonine-protein kinase n=1 Tax=Streptacidiphilus sp. EB129 TaxID=3156262 RepID=UPI00351927B0